MKRDEAEWNRVLIGCGVKPITAAKWSIIFAAVVDGKTFSKGDSELDDFLRETLHESGKLETLEENLNYSVDALLKMFGRHRISEADARRYGRIDGKQAANKEAIANCLYGGPWGAKNLGNIEPGSGWRYRGGGLIQATGAANLKALQKATGIPVYDNPELLRHPTRECLLATIAWWEMSVPDSLMDNVRAVRKAVNGGANGLEDTTKLDGKVKAALA